MLQFIIHRATKDHCSYAETICHIIEESARLRGTGIAKRDPEYIRSKMREGKAVVAVSDDGRFAGFCYIETWEDRKYVANSGLIVAPEFRKMHLAKRIKEAAFNLSREKYPDAKMFGITTSAAVLKINNELGYRPAHFSELTTDDAFWKGCEVCLYCSQNFGFVSLPADASTGSSLMPHKSSPDVFELIRAKSNRLQAVPNDIVMVTNNLPSGYHRDVQILKESVIPAFDDLHDVLAMCMEMLPVLKINGHILDDDRYTLLSSVDAVHAKVQEGMGFRDAYREVGERIMRGEFTGAPAQGHTHEGSIGNLRTDLIRRHMAGVASKMEVEAIREAERELTGQ